MAVHVSFAALETSVQTWDKCLLAVACEAKLGPEKKKTKTKTKTKDGKLHVYCLQWQPTNNCKMKLAPYFSFQKWQINKSISS